MPDARAAACRVYRALTRVAEGRIRGKPDATDPNDSQT